jgi:hypothetical protein
MMRMKEVVTMSRLGASESAVSATSILIASAVSWVPPAWSPI